MPLLLNNLAEKRDHPSRPSDALLYALGGGLRTYTGLTVNENNALKSIPLFAAVRRIAETIGSLPLHLYKRLTPKGKERAIKHPLYNILHLKPNPEMSSMTFRETGVGHLLTWGNWYSEIEKDGHGTILGLWPLLPGNMEDMKRIDGKLYYLYRLPNGQPKIFPRDKILHVRGFSENGIMGYSMIDKGREGIALALGLEEYGARFFGNGAKPPIALEHPGELSAPAQERLRVAWNEAHQGLSNAHRVAILEEGMKLKEFGVSPEDAQALQAKEFQVEEIARLLGIQPHKIADLRRSTFSNIEEQNIEFVVDTIRPWLVRIEQSYSIQLLKGIEQNEYFFEHLVDGLLRGNAESRWNAYAKGFMIGAYSIDDILEMENRNPVEGGDKRFIPLNMQPLDWVSGEPPEKPQKKLPINLEEKSIDFRAKSAEGRARLKNAYHRLFKAAAERVVNRESIAIKREIGKHLGQRNIRSLEEWINEFYQDLPKYIKKSFLPVLFSYAEAMQVEVAGEIGEEPKVTEELHTFMQEYTDRYSERHIESSLGQLQALIRDTKIEDLEETLETRADEWAETRPDKIANRETRQAGEAVASFVILAAAYKLVWNTVGKSCPYCNELNGMVIEKGQTFVQSNSDLHPAGTEKPMSIYRSKAHPPLHQGCDCYVGPG